MTVAALENTNTETCMTRIHAKLARDKDLTRNAIRVLMYLLSTMSPGEKRVIPIPEIQRAVDIGYKANISTCLKMLERAGYIKRYIAEKDSRERDIMLLAV
jgi:DNA-binding MarR family transcriptional regulator